MGSGSPAPALAPEHPASHCVFGTARWCCQACGLCSRLSLTGIWGMGSGSMTPLPSQLREGAGGTAHTLPPPSKGAHPGGSGWPGSLALATVPRQLS